MSTAVVFQTQSILIYSLMIYGIMKRKNRKIHVPVMSTVLLWDVLLILQIELGRGAVEKASKAVVNPMILNIHVTFAVLSVIFYVLLVLTGRKLLKGEEMIRARHRLLAGRHLFLEALLYSLAFLQLHRNRNKFMAFENVKALIKSGLPDAHVEVNDMTGTADHLDIMIISNQFTGKMLIAQHQMVMDLLKESLKAEIHAVQLKTMDYATAQKRGIQFK